MPSRLPLRHLLIAVLLAVIVPFQGAVAAAAGVCMAFGHHDMAAAQQDSAAHDHEGHDGHAGHSGHAPAADPDPESAHCGPCAACCAAVSIAPAPAPVVVERQATPSYDFTPSPHADVAPHPLDRPPLAS